jgi:hypothetical protein
MKATLMLCDAAQVADGKINILGGGWTQTSPGTPSALAISIGVPWDNSNDRHRFEVHLDDADGQPVTVPNPQGGMSPLIISRDFETGRPPGVPKGSTLWALVALTIGPLPLQPGGRYVWSLFVNHHTEEDWTAPFSVRALVPSH